MTFSFSQDTFLDRYRPYIELSRFDKPIGAWLVLFPAFCGLTLAHQGMPPFLDLVLFTLGAFLVRGAGCTANDLLDRNFDPHVERTKNRPLARKAITLWQALAYLLGQLVASSILLLFMPVEVFCMALGAIALMLTYPLLKRITYWPQLFLGFCMNYSMLMAYVYVTKTLSLDILVLYGGAVLWTLVYDTIYAHQDKRDDVKIGVKSLALSDLGKTRTFLIAGYSLFVASIAWVFLEKGPSLGGLSLLVVPAGLLTYQLWNLDLEAAQSCFKAFKHNAWVGFGIWVTLVGFFLI